MPADPKEPSDLTVLREAVLRFITAMYGPDVAAELVIYTNCSTKPGRMPFGILPLYWKQKRARQRRERKRLLRKLRLVLELRKLRKRKNRPE